MAWMDDTLPPKDVRRIGRQLERSKFSQDLSRRIRRVVRQRRLTIPGMGSNQPVEANVVAAYLDNNLPGEATSTYESLCLNSDVHLAEVAATHEILSVLEHPCPIAPETYASMYRIVKAPESRIPSDRPLPRSASSVLRSERTRTDGGIPADHARFDPPFARNSAGFIAASLSVAGVLAFASFALDRIVGPVASISPIVKESSDTLTEPGSIAPFEAEGQDLAANPVSKQPDRSEKPPLPEENEGSDPAKPAVIAVKAEPTVPKAETPAPVKDFATSTGPDAGKALIPKQENPAPAETVPALKPNFIALSDIAAVSESTILFTAPTAEAPIKSWSFWKNAPKLPSFVRFAGADSVKLTSGSLSFAVEPGSLLELPEEGPPKWLAGRAEAASLGAGQIRFRTGTGREFTISFPNDAKFQIEVRNAAKNEVSSEVKSPGATVVIRTFEGNLTVTTGRTETTVPENRSLRIESSGLPSVSEEMPKVTEAIAPELPGAALVNRMMRRYLGTNRPVATSIIDAETDDLPDVRGLALKIALWIDREDIVIGVLTDLENPELRKSAISAVKEISARGEDSARRVLQGCIEELALADADAELLSSLLIAPATEESLERKQTLVKALEHDSRLVRQLALDRLMQISRRDSMGFDPDEPTVKGIEAWRAWIGMDSQGPRP